MSVDTTSPPIVTGRPSRRRALTAVAGIVVLVGGVVGYQARRSRVAEPQPKASVMPAATVAAAPTTALEFTQHGLGLLRRFDRTGNIDKAIASFESAITLDKTFAPAWAGLARAFWRQGFVTGDAAWAPRAVDAATQATTLDAYLADAHVSLGLAKLSAGDVAAARQALEYALTLDPGNAGAHRGLGDIDDDADRKAQAAERYERALASDPTDWDLMKVRGVISYDRAEYAEALVWYQRAADAAPDSASPSLLIGSAHHMLGDFASAAASFQRSLGIQPTDSGYTNLGTALFFQGRYRESLQAFERAVELAPSRAILWGNLADAYRWVPGNTAKSQEAYGRAIARLRDGLANDSSNVVSRSRLALYLAKSGDTEAALMELAKVPTRTTTEVNMLFRGAVTYELAGDRANALAMLESALDRGYGLIEVRMDPELAALRKDVRYHRLIGRYERSAPTP